MKHMILSWLLMICLAYAPNAGNVDGPLYHRITPVGTVPDACTELVSLNLLGSVRSIRGGLFTWRGHGEGRTVIARVDAMGRELACCELESGELQVSVVTGTADGGFLIALGFHDRALGEGAWLSDGGVVSRVIKCGADGTAEWACDLPEVNSMMLRECFETETGYCFLGERETPATKRRGVVSATDLSCLTISRAGGFVSLRTLGGSDFDMFDRAV